MFGSPWCSMVSCLRGNSCSPDDQDLSKGCSFVRGGGIARQLFLLGSSKQERTGCLLQIQTVSDRHKANRHWEALLFPAGISVLARHLFPIIRYEIRLFMCLFSQSQGCTAAVVAPHALLFLIPSSHYTPFTVQ